MISYRALAKAAAVDVMNLHVQTPHPAYKRADGNDVGRQAMLITKKVLSKLEAELNKLLQRRSEIIHNNKSKKIEINHLRRMRIQTEITHNKYENTILEIKQNIERLSTESNDIIIERERLVKEKDILEKINLDEQKTFSEQHEAMSDFIKGQNSALEEALLKERKFDKNPTTATLTDTTSSTTPSTTLALTNTNTNTNSTALTTTTTTPAAGNTGGNGTTATDPTTSAAAAAAALSLEEEIDMARQVSRLTNFVHNEQNSLSSIQDRINSYESMFESLKNMTSANNLDDVIITYLAHEEEMFSLYSFIQVLYSVVVWYIYTVYACILSQYICIYTCVYILYHTYTLYICYGML